MNLRETQEATAAEAEQAVEAEAIRILQEELERAAEAVIGPAHREVWRVPKEAVRLAKTPHSGPDLTCHAPATIWKRLRVRLPVDGIVSVRTVSEYGLHRERVFTSAAHLADEIIAAAMEPSSKMSLVAANIRTREDGSLQIITQLHLRRQRFSGKLHCDACGLFFLGERGLRDHVQIKHKNTYEVAKEAVAAARGAVMTYTPPQGTCAALTRLWAARAVAAEQARNALPMGLAAARDGEIERLRVLVLNGRCAYTGSVRRVVADMKVATSVVARTVVALVTAAIVVGW